MNTQKFNAIVISSIDYKEKDKIVKLFTLEAGIIAANLKGVRSEKAKLKFAAQPFCFGVFDVVKKAEHYTIVGVDLQDSFFDLTKNLNNYYIASSLLEVVQASLMEGQVSTIMFVNLLKALKNICYDKADAKLVLTKFILGTLKVMGYRFNFKNCDSCNMPYINKKYINLQTGALSCGSCASSYSKQLSDRVFNLIKVLYNTDIDKLPTINATQDLVGETLDILLQNFQERTERKLKTLKQLI